MSVRSFAYEANNKHDWLMDALEEAAEGHGLDPDSEEVLDAIREIFGGEIREHFEEWIEYNA